MKHLILGAGPIGRNTAQALIDLGDSVSIATRSGTAFPGATAVALDAKDANTLSSAAEGKDTIIVATNPPYQSWQKEWPTLIDSVIAAAKKSGLRIVLMGNLYSHDPSAGPMTETSPLVPRESKGMVRKNIWERLLHEQRQGTLKAAEVRASDYFGPAAGPTAHLGDMFFKPLIASKTAYGVGRPDLPHAWAYLPDIAATIAAVARRDDTWGRAWLVPHATQEDRVTLAKYVTTIAETTGTVRPIPQWLLRAMGAFSPMMREVAKSSYQFRMPFLVDSSHSESMLNTKATPLEEALEATVSAYQRAGE